jgi:glycine betaine/proline transport system substrate-binding protein
MEDKWPDAFAAVQAYTLTNEEMSAMVGDVDLNGQDIDSVVANWMASNKNRWSGWIAK